MSKLAQYAVESEKVLLDYINTAKELGWTLRTELRRNVDGILYGGQDSPLKCYTPSFVLDFKKEGLKRESVDNELLFNLLNQNGYEEQCYKLEIDDDCELSGEFKNKEVGNGVSFFYRSSFQRYIGVHGDDLMLRIDATKYIKKPFNIIITDLDEILEKAKIK